MGDQDRRGIRLVPEGDPPLCPGCLKRFVPHRHSTLCDPCHRDVSDLSGLTRQELENRTFDRESAVRRAHLATRFPF